ncbi:hypothetical protein GGI20_001591 [Coemansia sp. BCRC 34301]|nr:hypothetical protein GGI20_001591 [Coemansia sp. BCRC 34301]
MQTLSIFQLLPPHTVQLVIEHVLYNRKPPYSYIWRDSDVYKRHLRPLLWVCNNFRAIAYPLYCRGFQVDLDYESSEESESWNSWSNPFGLAHSTLHLVNHLTISLKEASVYTGAALRALSRGLDGGCALPLLRVLTVFIVADEGDDVNEYIDIGAWEVENNIGAFVQRVEEMAATLHRIRVEYDNIQHIEKVTHMYANSLVPQLLQLAKRIDYDDCGEVAIIFRLHVYDMCQLTHIKCRYEGAGCRFMLLARLNSQTLQSLNLAIRLTTCTSMLIDNDDGSHATYPQLVTLILPWWSHVDPLQRAVFSNDVVPFPRLAHIDIAHSHPFGDDTLFRGNAATLERLTMKLDATTVSMLRRHEIFTPTSHPKLQWVKISYEEELIPGTFATVDESVHFSLNIGPKASVRNISGATNINNPAAILAQLGNHTSIQALTLGHARLDLWDVVALIKSLPLLSYLDSFSPRLGSIPVGVTKDELPAYVVATYAPVGKRFWSWSSYYISTDKQDEVATCMLLLALICPSFSYAATNKFNSWGFKEAMERAIASDMFKQYAPRLQHLSIRGRNYDD